MTRKHAFVRLASTVLLLSSLSFLSASHSAQAAPPQQSIPTSTDSTDFLTGGYTIYALTTVGNNLLRFNSTAPGLILSTVSISGLQPGESVLGIDFRPATGQLYAVGGTSRIYTIDTTTGAATLASTITTTMLSGTEFGVDFNPVVDRLRVVSNLDQNLRINVDNGATIIDGTLAYTTTDVNAGQNPNVTGAAYTNNITGATSTTLYVIDSNLDVLATQNPPNNGTLNTVGALGSDAFDAVGFDIAPAASIAFAAWNSSFSSTSQLYTINLSTGVATSVGNISGGQTIRDIAVAPSAPLFALTVGNNLLRLDSAAPGNILGNFAISGLQAGENVLGIDYRPATGQLYALGSTSRLYALNTATGAATQVGTSVLSPTLNGTEFGFDFNPTVDRIRVTSDADQNLRLNPISGTVAAVDGTLAYTTTDINAGQNPSIVGAAYTNNMAGVTTTVLYDIDSNLNVLVIQNPPNNGTLNTVGSLGLDVTNLVGFDIQKGSGTAYASLMISGTVSSGLYTINLNSGKANLLGTIGGSEMIRDVAVIPLYNIYLPLIARDTVSTTIFTP